MMRNKARKLLSSILVISLLATSLVIAKPIGQANAATQTVTVNVDGTAFTQINKAKNVGVNIEMSLTSDKMWNANGKWMEETFNASDLNMMRWGYDAWAFDWELEVPLCDKYWGALNSKDAAGTFGLYEFIDFCNEYDVIPFIMLPIESLDTTKNGGATLQKVKDLASAMATYINSQGIPLAYFDMGNEPWNTHTSIDATYYGGLCSEFQPLIKAANSNYKLVLQRAPENILWSAWNRRAESAGAGYFDAYDDHRYAFYDWNKYYDKNNDSFFTPGPAIAGAEALMGECNIGWTPTNDDWQKGHTRDLGGGMALLNAMLDTINNNVYSYILSWPSHWPSKASVSGSTDTSFGWFNLDAWYDREQTERLTGVVLAHMIINQNVLDRKLNTTSSSQKVRTFAYTDNASSQLKLIAINKWDPANMTINIPAGYNYVSAQVMKGTSVWDSNPEYVNHLTGSVPVSGTTFTDAIPAECVVVYTFFKDETIAVPGSFQLTTPTADETDVSTAKTFQWSAAQDAKNYNLVVSKNNDFSNPTFNVYTGNITQYQPMKDLEAGATYYCKVTAVNKNGSTEALNNGIAFTTATAQKQELRIWNDDSKYISHSSNWNDQTFTGCYMNDDHSCKQTDGYVEFNFTGTQAKIYGVKGTWCGKADVQVNFGAKTVIDTYSPTTQYQSVLYDTGTLPYGTYTVTLTVKGEKNPSATDYWIEFDKAEVLNASDNIPQRETITWNDESPNISKSSFWTHQSVAGSYHDDDTSGKTWNTYMKYSFYGTESKIYGLKGSWCGKADIQVDGVTVATIDTYAATTEYQAVLFDTGILPLGNHTVKLIVKAAKNSASSGKWIEYDKVEIK